MLAIAIPIKAANPPVITVTEVVIAVVVAIDAPSIANPIPIPLAAPSKIPFNIFGKSSPK